MMISFKSFAYEINLHKFLFSKIIIIIILETDSQNLLDPGLAKPW